MRRSSVAAILALLVLGTFVASGAHLTVSGPILQRFSFEVDHVPPPVAEAELYVDVHRYAGNNNQFKGTTRVGPFTVPAGGEYVVGYDGTLRACPDHTGGSSGVDGPFTESGVSHVICVQHGDAHGRVVSIGVGDDVERLTVDGATEAANTEAS